MKKHFPLYFHLVYEMELVANAFVVNHQPHDVPCVFQIWEKRDKKRYVPKKVVLTCYTFVKKEEQPDISFRRIGVYAGKIDKEVDTKLPQIALFLFDSPMRLQQNNTFNCVIFTTHQKMIPSVHGLYLNKN